MTQSAVCLFVLLLVAACWDYRWRKVPNVLLFPAMLLGLSLQIWAGKGWQSVEGICTAFVLSFLPVLLRGMGMGDQKLLMVVGAWTSGQVVYSLFWLSILIALCLVGVRPRTWPILFANLSQLLVGWLAHRQVWLPNRQQSALVLPYAVCLFLAYCIWLWEGEG